MNIFFESTFVGTTGNLRNFQKRFRAARGLNRPSKLFANFSGENSFEYFFPNEFHGGVMAYSYTLPFNTPLPQYWSGWCIQHVKYETIRDGMPKWLEVVFPLQEFLTYCDVNISFELMHWYVIIYMEFTICTRPGSLMGLCVFLQKQLLRFLQYCSTRVLIAQEENVFFLCTETHLVKCCISHLILP